MRTKWAFLIFGKGKMINLENVRLIPTFPGNESPIPHSQIVVGPTSPILIPDFILRSKYCQ